MMLYNDLYRSQQQSKPGHHVTVCHLIMHSLMITFCSFFSEVTPDSARSPNRELLGLTGASFYRPKADPLAQPCHCTEIISEHWLQSVKIINRTSHFLIQQYDREGMWHYLCWLSNASKYTCREYASLQHSLRLMITIMKFVSSTFKTGNVS